MSCHAAPEQAKAMAEATRATLEQYAADYPKGPHDQPQSMCPAFGSLRVGLRSGVHRVLARMAAQAVRLCGGRHGQDHALGQGRVGAGRWIDVLHGQAAS